MKRNTQTVLAAIVAFGAILVGSWSMTKDSNFIWYWVFGLALGLILQRSRLCFVSAASEPLITGSTEQFRAILIGILLSSFGITVVKFLSNGQLDMLGVSTVSLPLILGAFLFGTGMILSGACASGMFVRLAEGYSIHIFTIVSAIIGYSLANSHYQTLWAPFVINAPAIFLPSELGWGIGVAANIVVILMLYLVAYKQEQDISSSNRTTFLKGAVCLGILNVLHLLVLESTLSVTGAFFWIKDIANNPLAFATNLRNLGLFTGALIGALAFGNFKWKKIRSVKQILTTVMGGLLMGYGACIAGGCNISAFFTSAACLSISAWAFMLCLFAGTFVGTKILYKIL